MKICDDFIYNKGTAEIDLEDIYIAQGEYPVYSAQSNNNGVMGFMNKADYEDSGIRIITVGNVGKTSVVTGKYSLAQNNGVLIPKNKDNYENSLDYIRFQIEQWCKSRFSDNDKSKGLGETLTKEELMNVEFDLPPIEEQLAYVKQMNMLKEYNDKLNFIIEQCDDVLRQIVEIDSNVNHEQLPIDAFFKVITGSRITQTDVYEHQGDFPCVTSQTENDGIAWYADKKWLIDYYGKKIVNEKECLTWSKDGNAGEMFYRDYAFYPNDHCGVLILKPEYQNELNIKWFMYTYRNWIKSFASSDSSQPMLYNGTVKAITIPYPFPSMDFQNRVVEQYNQAQEIKNKCLQIKTEIKKIWDFD